ncbi:MAG: hypothetical protein ACLFU7_09120 [Armatimonadota bacterium]
MSLSAMQLRRFRLSRLELRYNEDWIGMEDHPDTEAYSVGTDFDVFGPTDNEYAIRLEVDCKPSGEGATRYDGVGAEIWGIFVFTGECGEDEVERMLVLNAPAILHGVLRGIIANASGSCAGGPFVLPAVNYIDVFKHKMQQLELPEDPASDDEEASGEERP